VGTGGKASDANLGERLAATTVGGGEGAPAQSATTDDDLLAVGDVRSFERVYQRHVDAVYRYVASRVATREDAEDLTSEAFHRAWGSLRAYRGTGTFRAWLFGIVRRTLAGYYRAHNPSIPLDPDAAETIADEQPGPEEAAIAKDRRRIARRLLATLTAEQQEILVLRFVAELPYAEIGQVVGKREEAVKKIAYRAIAELNQRSETQ
jgi:RNA polymerase sigma-70 factor (ECF subfamily)